MKNECITHPGIIKSISNNLAEVSIIVNSGCASCESKGSCAISEAKEKVIEVVVLPADNFETGQHVMVEMKQSMGNWAVLLGYFFPFLVVFITLIILTSIGIDEGLSAIISLGVLIPYYAVLYFTKDHLRKNFTYNMQAV